MSPTLILPILETWRALYVSLESSPYAYCQIFENKGAAVGCSNPHPHCQVWTTTHIPHEPLVECTSLNNYHRTYNSCLLCDYVQLELQRQERVVSQRGIWVAICPYWAIWPFEILLLPTLHIPSLRQLSLPHMHELAEILSDVTIRYDNLFQCSFPYSMGIHQKPSGEKNYDYWHFHIHYFPPLLRSSTIKKFMVGYELMANPQRDITAEKSAEMLKEQAEIHYQLKM